MKFTTIKIEAPAHWAGALINGDDETYGDIDQREIAMWLADNKLTANECVGIDDGGDGDCDAHIGRFVFPIDGYLQTELYTYIFMSED